MRGWLRWIHGLLRDARDRGSAWNGERRVEGGNEVIRVVASGGGEIHGDEVGGFRRMEGLKDWGS